MFDIIEQFTFHELFEILKEDPFYHVDSLVIYSVAGILAYWICAPVKYSVYTFFKRMFFRMLVTNLEEKFHLKSFFVTFAFFFFGLVLSVIAVNVEGMIPESLTLTAYTKLPMVLSIWFFAASFFTALEQTNYKLPRGFLPSGVPIAVGPFLYIIEFISYFIRLLSLAIRLFINLLAGHILLKIFSIISIMGVHQIIYTSTVDIVPNLFMIVLDISFFFLEYLACLLQAIVLVSLIAIYFDHAFGFFH